MTTKHKRPQFTFWTFVTNHGPEDFGLHISNAECIAWPSDLYAKTINTTLRLPRGWHYLFAVANIIPARVKCSLQVNTTTYRLCYARGTRIFEYHSVANYFLPIVGGTPCKLPRDWLQPIFFLVDWMTWGFDALHTISLTAPKIFFSIHDLICSFVRMPVLFALLLLMVTNNFCHSSCDSDCDIFTTNIYLRFCQEACWVPDYELQWKRQGEVFILIAEDGVSSKEETILRMIRATNPNLNGWWKWAFTLTGSLAFIGIFGSPVVLGTKV